MFEPEVIDPSGPQAPWGKTVGDINGDGLPDVVVGGHQRDWPSVWQRIKAKLGLWSWDQSPRRLVWYENPTWTPHLISTKLATRTDLEVADVDGDGRNDLVLLSDAGLLWLRNPQWMQSVIDTARLHDIEVSDIDRDGDIDLVARNQSRFSDGAGNRVYLYRQNDPAHWTAFSLDCPHGEGLAVEDLDGDGFDDVVVNQLWFRNPGEWPDRTTWDPHTYTGTYTWQDVFVDVVDVDSDGRRDILLAPSEAAGEHYRISWFESPIDPRELWVEHVVDPDVEAVHHFVAGGDIDGDGATDIVTAEMNQGADPDEIKVYLNSKDPAEWHKMLIGTDGSHSMRLVDIDRDFDLDLVGANWEIADYDGKYPVSLWRNRTAERQAAWRRHVIDDERPGQAVFIFAADLDRDGYTDVVTGAWWYRNPGIASGDWERHAIDARAGNVILVDDLDSDGDPDILASGWRGYDWQPSLISRALGSLAGREHVWTSGSELIWGSNDGTGQFKTFANIPEASGDFPQGSAVARIGGNRSIVLSWHRNDTGLQALSVPPHLTTDRWEWHNISSLSQNEAVSVGDIDADGDDDLLLGTAWLRQDHLSWTRFVLHSSERKPDRNQLVDMNGDGRLDAVVGYEAISEPGLAAWYEQGSDPTHPWTEQVIDHPTGPMSLSVTDFDGDGDVDVVVGEHDLAHPDRARLIAYENADGRARRWQGHLIYRGDEHHDGALVVDIDNDGDLDVVSIGWSHHRVLLYERLGVR